MTNTETPSDWKRMRFKRNKVWMALDSNGRPLLEKGKVLIKYQLDQDHQYWVHPKSIHSLEATPEHEEEPPAPPEPQPIGAMPPPSPTSATGAQGVIHIHTDGACSGNPGPAGIGVVMQYGPHRKEISRHIGMATNNIAELEAIRIGLEAVKNKALPVVVYTDSSYALGLLDQGWKPKQNRQLVQKIKALAESFKDLRFIKVRGHAGDVENERADQLAVEAIHQKG